MDSEASSCDSVLSVVHHVQRRILGCANAPLRLEQMARALGVTARTLQRHLRAEGTTYRELVDRARLELAVRGLERAASASTLSESLGFSEPAAFQRAFKRWTGTTVRAYFPRQPAQCMADRDGSVTCADRSESCSGLADRR